MVNIISDYIPPFSPLPNIAPFTYKDGETYLSTLENLRTYVNTTLVDFVNTNFSALGNDIIADINVLITTVNSALTSQNSEIDVKITALTTVINDKVALLTATNQTTAEAAVTSAFNNVNSTLSVLLANRFANKATQTTVETGRLSQSVLDGKYERKTYYNVLDYGAKGDGVTDDTIAIQAAINAAMTPAGTQYGGHIVFFPTTSGHYRYSKLTINGNGDQHITLQGENGGSYLRCVNTDGTYSIEVNGVGAVTTDVTGALWLRFVTFRDLTISGSPYWNSTNQTNSGGIHLQCVQFVTMENVWIGGFTNSGLRTDALWDSYFENVNIAYCGHAISDTDYAYSMRLSGNSNALVFNKLHIEQYHLALYIDAGSRQNSFIGCKFEDGGSPIAADGTTLSQFWFTNHYETSFVGGLITTDRSTGKYIVNASQNDQSPTTTYNVRRSLTFSAVQFMAAQSSSGLWAKGSNIKFVGGCVFNRTNGMVSGAAFNMEGGCLIADAQISMAASGIFVFRASAGNNVIHHVLIYGKVGATTGALITLDGAYDGNSFTDINFIGQFDIALGGSLSGYLGASKYSLLSNSNKTVTGGATPSVFMTDMIVFALTTALTVTDFIHGTQGKLLIMRGGGAASVTISNNAAIVTKSGANVVLTAGQTMMLTNDAGIWREV